VDLASGPTRRWKQVRQPGSRRTAAWRNRIARAWRRDAHDLSGRGNGVGSAAGASPVTRSGLVHLESLQRLRAREATRQPSREALDPSARRSAHRAGLLRDTRDQLHHLRPGAGSPSRRPAPWNRGSSGRHGDHGRHEGGCGPWGHRFLPALPPFSVGDRQPGSKGPEISVEDEPLADGDPELLDLRAQSRRGKRRVDADDVTARAVRDRLEQIAAGAVDLGERDEGAPQVVAASRSELQELEVRR
jgi:hypothetical protein